MFWNGGAPSHHLLGFSMKSTIQNLGILHDLGNLHMSRPAGIARIVWPGNGCRFPAKIYPSYMCIYIYIFTYIYIYIHMYIHILLYIYTINDSREHHWMWLKRGLPSCSAMGFLKQSWSRRPWIPRNTWWIDGSDHQWQSKSSWQLRENLGRTMLGNKKHIPLFG